MDDMIIICLSPTTKPATQMFTVLPPLEFLFYNGTLFLDEI